MSTKVTAPQNKRVLVIEDETELSDILKSFLEAEGYQIEVCADGRKARYLLSFDNYDAVVSDINLPGGYNGVELLTFVRTNSKKKIPFVLMTGFSKAKFEEEANKYEVDGILVKPFQKEDLMSLLDKIVPLSKEAVKGNQKVSLDDKYSKINIDSFISGKEMKYDIFVRLNEFKFIKIAHAGESITMDRITAYKSKNIQHLYLTKEDFKRYINLNVELSKIVEHRSDIGAQKKMNLMKHANELVLEYFYHNEIDLEVLDAAKNVLGSSFSVFAESDDGAELLDVIKSRGDEDYAHQLGVSFYSILMAKRLGWTCDNSLHKLSLAGLLHDIGEKEIPKEVLNKRRLDLTPEEVSLLESHPIRSAEILSACASIPAEIIQVALQHHENCAGQGYPHRLRKVQISPMSRIIGVADMFCEMVLKGKSKMTVNDALFRLQNMHSQTLDQEYVSALAEVFGKPSTRGENAAS